MKMVWVMELRNDEYYTTIFANSESVKVYNNSFFQFFHGMMYHYDVDILTIHLLSLLMF